MNQRSFCLIVTLCARHRDSSCEYWLTDYLTEANRPSDHPQWYNAFMQNCTTTTRGHAQNAGAGEGLAWRLFANGHIDQLLYERGQIDTVLTISEVAATSQKGLGRGQL
jgi:hypothetical protein